MATEQEIRELKKRHSARLLSEPGVSGVGIEKDQAGEYFLTVHVDDAATAQKMPRQLDGKPIKVVKSGPFKKF
jgi:hypothetical protein